MRIHFDATVDELIEIQERVLARSKVARSWRRQGAVRSALLTGFITATPVFIFASAGFSLWLALLFAGIAFLFGAGLASVTHEDKIKQRLNTYFREHYGDRDTIPFELELRETGIWTSQLGVQSMVEWSNVEEMNQTEETIEFYVRGGGAIFVRQRAFTSTEEQRRFIDAARQHLIASRTSSNWLRDS